MIYFIDKVEDGFQMRVGMGIELKTRYEKPVNVIELEGDLRLKFVEVYFDTGSVSIPKMVRLQVLNEKGQLIPWRVRFNPDDFSSEEVLESWMMIA